MCRHTDKPLLLPGNVVNQIVNGVKAKMTDDKIGSVVD